MLTFKNLREANTARMPQFKNAKGEPAHSKPDGSDWSLNDWYTALMGEAGEAGNILKKIRRGDFSLYEGRDDLANEFADVAIYLDLLAKQCGINLDEAITYKFNYVTRRIGGDVIICEDGSWYHENASSR
jgi:NTP pyrophosphatase (non-canonical NTP hydrolase)